MLQRLTSDLLWKIEEDRFECQLHADLSIFDELKHSFNFTFPLRKTNIGLLSKKKANKTSIIKIIEVLKYEAIEDFDDQFIITPYYVEVEK